MTDTPKPPNPFFPLTALCGGAFVMTVFAMVAATFGDPEAPIGKVLDRYAGYMIGAEVVATLLFGFIALVVDRRQSLRREGEAPAEPRAPTDIQ